MKQAANYGGLFLRYVTGLGLGGRDGREVTE